MEAMDKDLEMTSTLKAYVSLIYAPRIWIKAKSHNQRMTKSMGKFESRKANFSPEKINRMIQILKRQEAARKDLLEVLAQGLYTGYAISAANEFGETIKRFRSALDREINRRYGNKRRRK